MSINYLKPTKTDIYCIKKEAIFCHRKIYGNISVFQRFPAIFDRIESLGLAYTAHTKTVQLSLEAALKSTKRVSLYIKKEAINLRSKALSFGVVFCFLWKWSRWWDSRKQHTLKNSQFHKEKINIVKLNSIMYAKRSQNCKTKN